MALTLDDIHTGDRVTVKITQAPTNAAARKTLSRILLKDPQLGHRQRVQKQTKQRNTRYHGRGGRRWAVRAPKQPVVFAQRGASGTVLATEQVLRDLGSVGRFVDIARV